MSTGLSSVLCECGCGQPVAFAARVCTRLGHLKGQPVRFVRGHSHRRNPIRFIIDQSTGCWNWNGYISTNGYAGDIPIPNGRIKPHRLFYQNAKGPIPDGMDLDHLCRNRRCVNPAHLEAVTPTENKRRGLTTKLTIDEVREIRGLSDSTSRSALARRFRVSKANILSIIKRETWKEVV